MQSGSEGVVEAAVGGDDEVGVAELGHGDRIQRRGARDDDDATWRRSLVLVPLSSLQSV